ncbi:hypothetical protein [Actinokineospora diospyrosa]|uniref:Uncharacterized protein n=1 Tax=Actinokineospora diospyrosa TaxID=103728 RepID=A0ABT1IL45_9PSEU|nr:hypothetical protein [Actinokineospora diospyrosa]MCP2273370.1 hypothetical protein [Actinokineospora diospyrosa]
MSEVPAGSGEWWVVVERVGEPGDIVEVHEAGELAAARELAWAVAREFKPRVLRRVQRRLVFRQPEGGYLVRVDGVTGDDFFRVFVLELAARFDGKGSEVTGA